MKHSSQAKYDPWSDQDCIEAFIEKRQEDFQFWATEKGIHKDLWCDSELTYCEEHPNKFLDFAHNFEKDLEDAEGERKWELSEDR